MQEQGPGFLCLLSTYYVPSTGLILVWLPTVSLAQSTVPGTW